MKQKHHNKDGRAIGANNYLRLVIVNLIVRHGETALPLLWGTERSVALDGRRDFMKDFLMYPFQQQLISSS